MTPKDLISATGETAEYARLYTHQQAEYLKLEFAKRLSLTTSMLLTVAVIAFLGFMVLTFLTIACGFWLGSIWGSYALAFLCLTGFYMIIAIVVFLLRKQIITNPLISLVIKSILD